MSMPIAHGAMSMLIDPSLEAANNGVTARTDAQLEEFSRLLEDAQGAFKGVALVEYATKYDKDFALTCADAATKSATASITKVACPATLGVVAVTPANGHDHYYSGGVYYPAKPDLTSAENS